MEDKKEYMIDDAMVEVKPCTFKEYKSEYSFESNEWNDPAEGYDVMFPLSGLSIFIPKITFETIAQPSEM